MLEKIEKAIESRDIDTMARALHEAHEYIQTHTLNYSLPERWAFNDLFRLNPEEYNQALTELYALIDKAMSLSMSSIEEFQDWIRSFVIQWENDKLGLVKTIILTASMMEMLKEARGRERREKIKD